MSKKPGDEFTVPLCRACHERQHRIGEPAFWREIGIDPIETALKIWAVTGAHDKAIVVIIQARRGR